MTVTFFVIEKDGVICKLQAGAEEIFQDIIKTTEHNLRL